MAAWALNREDLAFGGIAENLRPIPTINLPDRIHPIFARERISVRNFAFYDILRRQNNDGRRNAKSFELISKETYEGLRPSLQLATLFIQHSLPFFARLLWAKRQPLVYGGQTFNEQSVLDPNYQPTALDITITEQRLIDLAPRFFFEQAEAQKIKHAGGFHVADQRIPPPVPLVIYLRDDYHRYVRGPIKNDSPAQQQRFHWYNAIILVHEVCHALCWSVHSTFGPDATSRKEPVFDSDHYPEEAVEIGWSWQTWFFGGLDFAINGHPFAKDGLGWAPWTPTDRLWFRRTLLTDCLSAFFRHENWPTSPSDLLTFELEVSETYTARRDKTTDDEKHRAFYLQCLEWQAQADGSKEYALQNFLRKYSALRDKAWNKLRPAPRPHRNYGPGLTPVRVGGKLFR